MKKGYWVVAYRSISDESALNPTDQVLQVAQCRRNHALIGQML